MNTGGVCHGDIVPAPVSVTGFHGPPYCFALVAPLFLHQELGPFSVKVFSV